MDKKRVEQENLCLQTRMVIDKLRLNISLIDSLNLKTSSYYDKKLKQLKSLINQIYWNL